jgi:hypothetical protein
LSDNFTAETEIHHNRHLWVELEPEDEALRQAEQDGHAPCRRQHPLDPAGRAAHGKGPEDRKKPGTNVMILQCVFSTQKVAKLLVTWGDSCT